MANRHFRNMRINKNIALQFISFKKLFQLDTCGSLINEIKINKKRFPQSEMKLKSEYDFHPFNPKDTTHEK